MIYREAMISDVPALARIRAAECPAKPRRSISSWSKPLHGGDGLCLFELRAHFWAIDSRFVSLCFFVLAVALPALERGAQWNPTIFPWRCGRGRRHRSPAPHSQKTNHGRLHGRIDAPSSAWTRTSPL